MNQSWEKILIGKNYSWIFLKLLTFDKTQWVSFSNFPVSFYHEKHFERFRNCAGKFVRFLHNDIAKRGSGRADEKNWKGNFFSNDFCDIIAWFMIINTVLVFPIKNVLGRGAISIWRSRQESISSLHCQFGHR